MEKGPFYKEGALDRNGLFDPDQIAIYGLPALFDGEFDILAEFFLHLGFDGGYGFGIDVLAHEDSDHVAVLVDEIGRASCRERV